MNIILNKDSYSSPFGLSKVATLFCEEIWKQNTAESLLIRTKAIAYMDVGKGRKQDAEALSASNYLSLKHMDVLNVVVHNAMEGM